MNVLFVCSRNQWRSPTGERVWRGKAGLVTRSAGASQCAKRKVAAADVHWADIIMVMEYKHKKKLVTAFSALLENKPLYVLDIPDEYKYMDKELVEHFENVVPDLLHL